MWCLFLFNCTGNWFFGILLVMTSLILILAYCCMKLKMANQKMKSHSQTINKANKDLSITLRQQMMLQGELHHRVKNNLQVIICLLELQLAEISDTSARQSLQSMSNRIHSMAAIHEMLYQKESKEAIDLVEYTETLCQYFNNSSTSKTKFIITIEKQFFNLATLMPLGIILNELLTNSLKYASSLSQPLTININLEFLKDGYCINYRDNGPGFPKGELSERNGGLGTYLLNSMSRQLNGRLESYNDRGAVSKIFFKAKNDSLYTGALST